MGLWREMKIGDSIKVGEAVITFADKNGTKIRMLVEAPRSIIIDNERDEQKAAVLDELSWAKTDLQRLKDDLDVIAHYPKRAPTNAESSLEWYSTHLCKAIDIARDALGIITAGELLDYDKR